MWIVLLIVLISSIYTQFGVDCTLVPDHRQKCYLQLNDGYYYDLSGMYSLRTEDYMYMDDRGNTVFVNICNITSVPCDPYSPVCQLSEFGVYYSFGVLSSQVISSLNSSDSGGYDVQINYSGGQFCPSANSGSSTIYIKCDTNNSTNYGTIESVEYNEDGCHYSIYMSSIFACALNSSESELKHERELLQIVLPTVFGSAAIILVVLLVVLYTKRKQNKPYSRLPIEENCGK
eukprot:TRINITY_DN5365_c0_g1_i2.p1 TRINITY_DN5365_c0_g1~~TRINITY_DN5365_c0_g1_i2.p1  ORF type:complete len:232 (-),score=17.40 TRINITY_DN5365_c0_g1_i2:12-707(-)